LFYLCNYVEVNTCGFPPLEDREASLSLLMGLDFFGGGVIPTEETVSSITHKNLVGPPPPNCSKKEFNNFILNVE